MGHRSRPWIDERRHHRTKATSDLALYTTVISGTNSTMSFYLNGKQVGDVTYTIPAGGLTNYGDLVAYIGQVLLR